MTEQEWYAQTDMANLFESEFLWGIGKVSERKYRQFAVACCRRILHLMPDDLSRRAVEASERYADGTATEAELEGIVEEFSAEYEARGGDFRHLSPTQRWSRSAAFVCVSQHGYRLASEAAEHCSTAVGDLSNPNRPLNSPDEDKAHCDILRDLFNPFRPVSFDPGWRTSTVLALTDCIYQEWAFDRLPILADALQDAGCDNRDVRDHCQGGGLHVRGCWVVDLVLGKE